MIVLRAGQIVEEGRHTEGLAADGEYARFHDLQFQEQEMAGTPLSGDAAP